MKSTFGFFTLFSAGILIFPLCHAQAVPYRKYKSGEIRKYKLTTEAYRNDKLSGRAVSIAEMMVIKDGNQLSEEIKWLNKSTLQEKDTIHLDSLAHQVQPYRISLLPNGKVLLPKLTIPAMVGDITDFNTFFVVVSPALNIHNLSSQAPIYKNTELIQGDFADGVFILKGTDCIEVTHRLLKKEKKYSLVQTEFMPPATNCLTPLDEVVSVNTFDKPNNFQMIQKAASEKVNFFWGVETFIITTKIDNKSGVIIEANMTNNLNLKMRYNSTTDLKEYATELSLTIRRNVILELLT